MSDPHDAVASYEEALGTLEHSSCDDASAKLADVLLARDAVDSAIKTGAYRSSDLRRVTAADARLKEMAAAARTRVGTSTLEAWRNTWHRASPPWWWRLDDASVVEPPSKVVWTVAGGLLVAAAVSLATDISTRFLSEGPDFLAVFSTLVQAALALAAGGALVDVAPRWTASVFSWLGVKNRRSDLSRITVPLAFLVLLLGLRASLPLFAKFYNNRGADLQEDGRLTSALQNYRRATHLNRDYAEAHYNLATVHEDLLDYDQATVGYQTALRSAPSFFAARNNLARLYLERGVHLNHALTLLNQALIDAPRDGRTQYTIYKNLGWANLGLNCVNEAEAHLQEALRHRSDGAAAHCLLAQVSEARKDASTAATHWHSCLANAPGQEDEFPAGWLSLARERLRGGLSK